MKDLDVARDSERFSDVPEQTSRLHEEVHLYEKQDFFSSFRISESSRQFLPGIELTNETPSTSVDDGWKYIPEDPHRGTINEGWKFIPEDTQPI